jgi:crotonobetainyl-CoA:carnitine CoA-transferase CaiB-like acyl-CoA transferase
MPPPLLGQHTDEILGEIGFSPAEIQNFRVTGAV